MQKQTADGYCLPTSRSLQGCPKGFLFCFLQNKASRVLRFHVQFGSSSNPYLPFGVMTTGCVTRAFILLCTPGANNRNAAVATRVHESPT